MIVVHRILVQILIQVRIPHLLLPVAIAPLRLVIIFLVKFFYYFTYLIGCLFLSLLDAAQVKRNSDRRYRERKER